MMADVQLLGAHVDHLISVQQRLLDKAANGTSEILAENRKDPWPEPSPFDSLDALASRAASAWPSQPYNPGRYSSSGQDRQNIPGDEQARIAEAASGNAGPGVQFCQGEQWKRSNDAAELHCAVDSLERRSALFQHRIRECAQHVAERQRDRIQVAASPKQQS